MNAETEPPITRGPVDARIAAELPGLGLAWCAFVVAGDPLRRSPPALRERLRGLSDRHRGAQAMVLRSRPIPHSYRTLFRHLGMEPDEQRIPVEAYVVDRLTHGGYRARGLLGDALAVATVETEVGVWALDADQVNGQLGLGLAAERVSVVDETGAVAPVFAAVPDPRAVTAATRRLVLYAVIAPHVPEIAVEEALWTAWDIIDSPP